MFTLLMAIVTPAALVVWGLHRVGSKAIERGEFDARGRRISTTTAVVDAEFGRMTRTEQLMTAKATEFAGSDVPTVPMRPVDALAGLDLPAEVIEQIEQAVAERVTPWLEAAFEDGGYVQVVAARERRP